MNSTERLFEFLSRGDYIIKMFLSQIFPVASVVNLEACDARKRIKRLNYFFHFSRRLVVHLVRLSLIQCDQIKNRPMCIKATQI